MASTSPCSFQPGSETMARDGAALKAQQAVASARTRRSLLIEAESKADAVRVAEIAVGKEGVVHRETVDLEPRAHAHADHAALQRVHAVAELIAAAHGQDLVEPIFAAQAPVQRALRGQLANVG